MTVAGYPRYENYDKSAADRLEFAFPSHWSTTKTRFLFRFSKGLTITKENLQDEGIPCVNYGEIHSKFRFVVDPATNPLKCVSPDYLKSNNGSLLHHGDFVFADTSEDIEGSGNFTHLDSDIPTFAGYHTLIARADSRAQIRYLAYMLDSSAFRSQVQKAVKGVKVYSISQGLLKNLEVLLPPLTEQRAIAAFLDKKCAAIDEAVRIKQAQITLLQERRQILIQQAVTRGLNPHAPLKDSGIDWIGQIPAHWEVKRLRHVAAIRYGLGQPPKEMSDGLPLLRATNVERGIINPKNLIYVDELAVPKDRNAFLKTGEIIVVRSGAYTGDSAIVTEKYQGAVAGYDMVVTAKSIQAEYLACSLLSPFVLHEQIFLLRMRAAQPHLNREELGETLVLKPNDNEQKEIVEYAKNIAQKINKAITIKQSQITALKEYKTVLINAAVTGKIKVTLDSAEATTEHALGDHA